MNDFDNKQICSYKDIDRFGFTCDVCGRKVNGCHYINGMKFCAKCYQETFGNTHAFEKELRDKIKVLEKALELACEEINILEAKFGSAYIRANGYLVDYFKTEAKEMKNE